MKEATSSKEDKKGYLIGLAISFGITLLLAGLIILIQVTGFGLTFQNNSYQIFIDAFTLSSALMLLFYALTVLSGHGAFDILAYSIKLVWYNTFHRNIRKTKLPSSYQEYKEIKNSKERVSLSFIAFGSLPYMIVGLILCIPYYLLCR